MIAILTGLIGRNGLILALIAGGLAIFISYDQSRVSAGWNAALTEVNKQTGKLNDQARKRRSAALNDNDPAARLRQHYCGDC